MPAEEPRGVLVGDVAEGCVCVLRLDVDGTIGGGDLLALNADCAKPPLALPAGGGLLLGCNGIALSRGEGEAARGK